jgi:3-oxoacyl-[acyl-carrier protein] reductase
MIARKSGCIINISGTAGVTGAVDSAHIVASKAGLHGLTKALALELGPLGIRVNTLILGGIDTVRTVPIHGRAASVEEIPLRRRGSVHEVASASVFLCSDYASYITGQALHVNGGSLLA